MKVGYLLIEKKAHALGLLDTIKERLEKNKIELVKINDKIPIIEQGPFDIIIHKLSDYQRDAEKGDEIAIKIIEQMIEYEKNNKENCIFIDSIDMVFQLANRANMSKICEKASFKMNGYNVYVPKWIKIDINYDINKVKKELELNKVTYPILCKSLNAAEGEGAHDMQLIFNEYQLINHLKIVPCIAQQFINHDMNMCKIFVVDKFWCIVNRPSIRNFKNYSKTLNLINKQKNVLKSLSYNEINGQFKENINLTKCINETIIFNSHTVSKPDSSSFLNKYAKRYHQHISYGNNELLNDKIVDEIIKRLRLIIPFTLMGIDVIVHDNNYGLIDINFLPGYDGMSNFYDEFYNLLISKLNYLYQNKN